MYAVRPVSLETPAAGRTAVNDPVRGLAIALVDEVECGLIACDVHGTLRYANRSAREELAAARALKLVDRYVRCASGSSDALDNALLEAALHDRRQMIAVGKDADRLMVTVIPLRAEDVVQSSVLIMLGRRGPCSALGLEMLSMVHGLTLAERRVLAGLLAEDPPRKIADDNGVALSTVRSQIKSIREKVGVRNIEGLLIRAAEVPPVTPAWRRLGGSLWHGSLHAPDLRPSLAAA